MAHGVDGTDIPPVQEGRLTTAHAVWLATWTGFLAIGAVLPVLPRYVRDPVGGSDVAVGIVIGAFAVSAVIGRPIAGRLADLYGRKLIMAIGLGGLSFANALLFIDGGVAWLVVVRLIVGVADGWLFTSAVTWVLDVSPKAHQGRSIGLFGIAVWGGLSAGSALGEVTYRTAGFDAVWTLTALVPLIGLAIVIPLRDTHPRGLARAGRPSLATLVPRAAVRPGIALTCANIGFGTMVGFVVLHLEARSIAHAGAAFTVFAVTVALTRIVAGSIPDRLGPRRAALLAFAAHATGMALLARADDVAVALTGAIVMGTGFALLFPALALAVMRRVDEHERGAAMGAFTAFFDLGVGIGGPLAGAISAAFGYEAAFWMGVIAAVAGALVTASATAGFRAPEPKPG